VTGQEFGTTFLARICSIPNWVLCVRRAVDLARLRATHNRQATHASKGALIKNDGPSPTSWGIEFGMQLTSLSLVRRRVYLKSAPLL
jgi:hypothetical protein